MNREGGRERGRRERKRERERVDDLTFTLNVKILRNTIETRREKMDDYDDYFKRQNVYAIQWRYAALMLMNENVHARAHPRYIF